MTAQAHLAFDLGAESARAILGVLDGPSAGPRLTLHELRRAEHRPLERPDGLCWDLDGLWAGVREGLRAAAAWGRDAGVPLRSVGVDTWGVDFALLDAGGRPLAPPRCYRDPRHAAGMARLAPAQRRLYSLTGIQPMALNTLPQLLALEAQRPGTLGAARRLLFMPDLLHFMLCGRAANELSIASTSQMLDARSAGWAAEVLLEHAIPPGLLGPPALPGTRLGPLLPGVAAAAGADPSTEVVLPASHDTASAVAAAPAEGGRWAYLSSGTWSLLGTELDAPRLDDAARDAGFTNERGAGGRVLFHRNLTGLWIVQECRREFERAGLRADYAGLTDLARAAEPFRTRLDTAHAPLALPGDMPAKISAFARAHGDPEPRSPGQFVRACLEGLAFAYRRTLDDMERLLARRFEAIHIIGGGVRNDLLCQMTADATARRVVAGPEEAAAAGSILVQAAGVGRLDGPAAVRRVVRESFRPRTYEPVDAAAWDRAYARAREVIA